MRQGGRVRGSVRNGGRERSNKHMDINTYTYNLLLAFLDAFHRAMVASLKAAHGEAWFKTGIRNHLPKEYFGRVEEMLSSPMRVVDMGREDDELYGVEHIWSIVDGNWRLFEKSFGNKNRTQVYLGEITELRHNLAHRRTRHLVQRADLIRFCQNANKLLRSVKAEEATLFEDACNTLAQGGTPWGTPIGGYLPPHDEIYDEFIGRPTELQRLGSWFMGDMKPIVVWGYGGAGKSALAFKFAKEMQESALRDYQAVIWLTAKRSEFMAGSARERTPDFSDTKSFCDGVWMALYGDVPTENNDAAGLIKELDNTPCLIVVDDLDTLLDDVDTVDFLLHDLRASKKSKVLYTSRHQIPGLNYIEIQGFKGDELNDFIRARAAEYRVDSDQCINRAEAIHSVTGGYPLFVDDLIRYSMLVGIDKAVADWIHRKGDAAREYALRRQLEHLIGVSGDVLMAVAVSNRPLSLVEVGQVAGITDEDAEQGIKDLIKWRLLHTTTTEDSIPAFSMNANTRRLTMGTFKDHPRLQGRKASFNALTGERIPATKRKAIAVAIAEANRILKLDGIASAADNLRSRMTGELSDAPDLHGVLGWIYSQADEYVEIAREHFTTADHLGTRKVDPYYHWAQMEQRIADRRVGAESTRGVLYLWQAATRVVEKGLERCGNVDILCQKAGYFKSREAEIYSQLNEYVAAQGAYQIAIEWYEKALGSPSQSDRKMPRYLPYRGLVWAHFGLGDMDGLIEWLNAWRNVAGGDPNFRQEVNQVQWKFPDIAHRIPWIRMDGYE